MTDLFSDKRKISGDRVIARAEVVFERDDPFATWDNLKTGYMVLNIRGGCFYLGEYFNEQNIAKLFPHNGSGRFIKLTLSADHTPDIALENISVGFLRIRKEATHEGIVFRFLDISDAQLDILDSLKYRLPTIGLDEETELPLEQIITLDSSNNLDRSNMLELLD